MTHIVNTLLNIFGLELSKHSKFNISPEYLLKYNKYYSLLKNNPRGFDVFKQFRYECGFHPKSFIDHECEFAALKLNELKPHIILDIGSYRHFIIGLLSYFNVITVDIRNRLPFTVNENILVCDAKKINIENNSVDVVISLCAIEHFGLTRYGDEFDENGDIKAINEMIRVLKPNGHLIFSTTITNHKPSIAFNAHRIYNHKMILDLCKGLICEDELFFDTKKNKICELKDVTDKKREWNLYCGCWKKV